MPDQGAQRHQLGRRLHDRAGHQEHGHHGGRPAAAGRQHGHGLRVAGGGAHRQLHPQRSRAGDLAPESADGPGAADRGDERDRDHGLRPERPLRREGQAERQGRGPGGASGHLRSGRAEALRPGRRGPEGPAGLPGPGPAERRRHRKDDVGRRGAAHTGLRQADRRAVGRLQAAAAARRGAGSRVRNSFPSSVVTT